MALFMPTNISPSTLGALGNGTVDVTKGLTVSWQVDGQNAMTAFRIRIMKNTTQSTQLYDTGKISDGCPFYGRTANGNVVFFTYGISASVLSQAGIANGNSYKMLITQWWSDTESVTQQSASVFLCRAAPTLTINAFSNPVKEKRFTWTAEYTQAQGDPVTWVRWQLAEAGDLTNLLYDTGDVATAQFAFTYNGLFTGQTYAVRCQTETINGARADTGWQTFAVEYPLLDITNARVNATVCKALSGVRLTWPGAYNIPGTTEGTYTAGGGTLTLEDNASVVWDRVNGAAMAFSPPWSLVWRGRIQTVPGTLVQLTETEGDLLTVGVTQNGVTVTLGSVATVAETAYPMKAGDLLTVVLRPDRVDVYHKTMLNGLYPGETVYCGAELYPRGDVWTDETVSRAASGDGWSNFAIAKVKLTGPQICTLLWLDAETLTDAQTREIVQDPSWEPATWTETTRLWPTFSNGVDGGNLGAAAEIATWSIYRSTEGNATLDYVGEVAFSQLQYVDCAVRSQTRYTYYVFSTNGDVFTTKGMVSNEVCPCLWDWTVLQCSEDGTGGYDVENLFRFALNVTSGTVSNNNTPNAMNNFTKYPTIQLSPANYKSGKLSGYIGAVQSNGEYADTRETRDAIFALSIWDGALFLKNRKGDLWRVAPNGAIAMDTQDNTRQQAQIAAVPWVEIGDSNNVRISIPQSSGLFGL